MVRVDLEGVWQGDGDRGDVGVACAGAQVKAEGGVMAAVGALAAAELADRSSSARRGASAQLTAMKGEAEGDRGALVSDPFGGRCGIRSSWSGLIMNSGRRY